MGLHRRIRRALVTGGSRGIGLAVSRRLLDAGVEVHYCSRTPSSHKHERFIHVRADLACVPDGAESIIRHFSQQGLAPDVLVCNAGGFHAALIPRQDDRFVQEQMNVNFISHLCLVRWAAGLMMMQRFGRIVGVSSTAAHFPAAGQSVYGAAKAGLETFLKACALEFAGKGVTCNRVVPGYIHTRFSEEYLAGRNLKKTVPVGRAGCPEEVAEAVCFFLGENSSYLTGAQITVDGGLALAVK